MKRSTRTTILRARPTLCALVATLIIASGAVLCASATTNYFYDYSTGTQNNSTEVLAELELKGATVFDESSEDTNAESYASITPLENAILAQGATITLKNPDITKMGATNDSRADELGVNAAVLAEKDARLAIQGGEIDANDAYAHALFASGSGQITASKVNILTGGSRASGLMVADDGRITATETVVATSGTTAPAARTASNGGSIKIEKGQFKTTSSNSPTLFAAAGNISAAYARLDATGSNGITLIGSGQISLDHVSLKSGAESVSGNTEQYPELEGGIFLFQPNNSYDATGTQFSAKYSTITTKKGCAFCITNTSANITLEHNSFVFEKNSSSSSSSEEKLDTFMDILAAPTRGAASSSTTGGAVKMTARDQLIQGSITVDRSSTLKLKMEEGSRFVGALNPSDNAKQVTLTLSEDSVIVLKDNSYVDILNNAKSDNSNIYANGHRLYVAGEEVSINKSESIPQYKYNLSETGPDAEDADAPKEKKELGPVVIIAIAALVIAPVLIGVIAFFMIQGKKNKQQQQLTLQDQARARLEAQMRAQEQSPDFGKNQYPNVHV